MIQALKRFYTNFGDRGVMFIMFACSVVMHSLLAMCMELPAVNPDEIGVASVSAFYSGRDWSLLMEKVSYYYGYIQALFYAPLFMLFKNPYALYKACLVMNGVLISFIPLIAYHVAGRVGVKKVWQKLVAAVCSGCYITYVAHSKFIWNETICSLLPWALLWVIFQAVDCKKAGARCAWSAVAGLLCAVCYAAHSRLLAVVIAFVMTLLIVRIFMKRMILVLPVFFPVLALSFVAEHFAKKLIQQLVWLGNASGNTMESEADRVLGLIEPDGLSRFCSALFGHLYTFMTSTVGLGALAVALFFLAVLTYIIEWRRGRKHDHIDGVEVVTAAQHKYSPRMLLLGIYAFLAVGGSMALSVLFKFNSSQIGDIKDLTMFGRYTDNVAPLAVFFVLMFLFRYGIKIRQTAWGAGVYAYVCVCFFTISYPQVQAARGYRESPMLGLMPWRIGEDYTKTFTGESFIIMTAVSFSVLALIAVFVSCAKKGGKGFISAMMCALFTYTTLFAGFVYLPDRAEDNLKKTEPARMVSSLLYNEDASPLIVCYKLKSRNAGLIQFLNPQTHVTIIRRDRNIPDNCIIVADEETLLPLDITDYDYIGTEGGLSVYAHGETARDYMKYKQSADIAGIPPTGEVLPAPDILSD